MQHPGVLGACPKIQMFGVNSPQTWVIESDTFFSTECRHSCPKEACLYSLLLSRLECALSSDSSNVLAALSSILVLGKAQESPKACKKWGEQGPGLFDGALERGLQMK